MKKLHWMPSTMNEKITTKQTPEILQGWRKDAKAIQRGKTPMELGIRMKTQEGKAKKL